MLHYLKRCNLVRGCADFLYKSGADLMGRQIFVLVGHRFPARDIDLDKVRSILVPGSGAAGGRWFKAMMGGV